jgi:hypothetical protein
MQVQNKNNTPGVDPAKDADKAHEKAPSKAADPAKVNANHEASRLEDSAKRFNAGLSPSKDVVRHEVQVEQNKEITKAQDYLRDQSKKV